MVTIPLFILLGYEYQWLYPTGVFKRDFSSSKELSKFREQLPHTLNNLIQEGV